MPTWHERRDPNSGRHTLPAELSPQLPSMERKDLYSNNCFPVPSLLPMLLLMPFPLL